MTEPKQEVPDRAFDMSNVAPDFKQIIVLNESIIQSLKAQKARSDKLLDKYKNRMLEESQRPANRFLEWSKIVEPLIDTLISEKVTEYELMKRYDYYIKEMISVNQRSVIDQDTIDEYSSAASKVIVSLSRLEDKFKAKDTELKELDMEAYNLLYAKHQHLMSVFRLIPVSARPRGCCTYCGTEMSEDNSSEISDCCTECEPHVKNAPPVVEEKEEEEPEPVVETPVAKKKAPAKKVIIKEKAPEPEEEI